MRTSQLVFMGLIIASAQTVKAAEVAKQGEMSLIAQHLKDMRSQPTNGIRFVVGNNLRQPGEQYEPGDWFALACDVIGCELEAAKLELSPESWQGHYDETPTLGQNLSFKADSHVGTEVVAWFAAATAPTWLKKGNVPTYYSPRRPLQKPPMGGSLEAIINLQDGKVAQLVPMMITQASMKLLVEPYYYSDVVLLQLREDDKRQLLQGTLGDCSGEFHAKKYLQWSGDLDRDGKPDYLISFVDDEGSVHLYLSSDAHPHQLVRLAGVFNSPPSGGECDGGGFAVES